MPLTAKRIDHIDPSNLIVGGRRGDYIPLSYESNMLVFQTPYMEVRGPLVGTSCENIFEMCTWFRGDSIAKQTKWFQLIEAMEKKAIDHVVKNFDSWFAPGTKQINWRSIVKNTDNTESSYFVRWPVELKQGAIVDEAGRPVDPKAIRAGNLVKLIIECPNIWISGNKSGLMMVVRKILVRNQRLGGDQYDFGYDSEEDQVPIKDQRHIISMLAQPTERMPASDFQPRGDYSNRVARSVTFQQSTPPPPARQRQLLVESRSGQSAISDCDPFQNIFDEMDSSGDGASESSMRGIPVRGRVLGEPSLFTEMDDQ